MRALGEPWNSQRLTHWKVFQIIHEGSQDGILEVAIACLERHSDAFLRHVAMMWGLKMYFGLLY